MQKNEDLIYPIRPSKRNKTIYIHTPMEAIDNVRLTIGPQTIVFKYTPVLSKNITYTLIERIITAAKKH